MNNENRCQNCGTLLIWLTISEAKIKRTHSYVIPCQSLSRLGLARSSYLTDYYSGSWAARIFRKISNRRVSQSIVFFHKKINHWCSRWKNTIDLDTEANNEVAIIHTAKESLCGPGDRMSGLHLKFGICNKYGAEAVLLWGTRKEQESAYISIPIIKIRLKEPGGLSMTCSKYTDAERLSTQVAYFKPV